MEVRKQIINDFVTKLEETNTFKKIYKNIVPVWTQVKEFPAVAILYAEEEKERDNLTNSKAYFNGLIEVYIYNKQSKTSYEDILTDLIDIVYNVVEKLRYEKYYIVDMMVSKMKREGGIIHPYAAAKLDINMRFIKKV